MREDKNHPRMYLKFLLLKNLGQLMEKEGNLKDALELFFEVNDL
jgi:hypothetical protein